MDLDIKVISAIAISLLSLAFSLFNFFVTRNDRCAEKRKEIINRILPVRKKKDNNGLKQYNLVCLETNYEEHMFDDISNDTGNPECAQQ